MTSSLPKFVSTPAPLSDAIDAIEHGVKRRSARVWAPRYVGGALALRGVLQPLTELQSRFNRLLPNALSLADPAQGGLSDQHAKLGVAVDAAPAERARAGLTTRRAPASRAGRAATRVAEVATRCGGEARRLRRASCPPPSRRGHAR